MNTTSLVHEKARSTNSNNIIYTSAPGKLMLTGSYAVLYGKPSVVTAIDQRFFVKLTVVSEPTITISAPQVGVNSFLTDLHSLQSHKPKKEIAFIIETIRLFFEAYPEHKAGLQIETRSDFDATYGFGSSSAVTVALCKAFSQLLPEPLTNEQIFDLAYRVVQVVQGDGSGFDLAAAIWGGTVLYKRPGKVTPLSIEELPLVIAYSGYKVSTSALVARVSAEYKSQPQHLQPLFNRIGKIGLAFAECIENKRYKEAGLLLTEHNELCFKLGVGGVTLNAMMTAALQSGAFGATLSGSGGGDSIPVLVDTQHKAAVEQSLQEAGAKIVPVKVHADGVRYEK